MRTSTHRRLLPALALLLAVTACADPLDDEASGGRAAEAPLGSEEVDPARDALREEVDGLRALLAATRDHLEEAAAAGTGGELRTAADTAIELLVGDPADDTPPLFPVERGARGAGSERADRLTSVLTMTREAGGPTGRAVRELLRDLVAGDLGAWERDADGMLALVRDTATPGASMRETEEAIFELPGEATRALAWALLAREEGELGTATAYAERGATHLDVAVEATGQLDLEAP